MKKRCVALALFFLFSSPLLGAEFRASRDSMRYHVPTCREAKNIKPSNMVTFQSAEEAMRAGYGPCKICRPPSGLKADSYRVPAITRPFDMCGIKTSALPYVALYKK